MHISVFAVLTLFFTVVATLHAAEPAASLPEEDRIFELIERTGTYILFRFRSWMRLLSQERGQLPQTDRLRRFAYGKTLIAGIDNESFFGLQILDRLMKAPAGFRGKSVFDFYGPRLRFTG